MDDSTMTRIGVIASNDLRSFGLSAIIEEIPGLAVQRLDITDLSGADGFGLLVLDTREPVESILQIVARQRKDQPSARLIVMTAQLSLEEIQAVIGAGAKGFLLDSAGVNEIGMAIGIVLDGSIWAPRKVMARLVEAGASIATAHVLQPPESQPIETLLTDREREVLHLLMNGRSNREIGSALGIEQATVKAHLGRMLRKSRSSNRVELTLRAMEEKLAQAENADQRHGSA